eukprot:4243513-Alexandrium_andersonii.AAC.1
MLRKTQTTSYIRLPSGAATHVPSGIFAGPDVSRSAPSPDTWLAKYGPTIATSSFQAAWQAATTGLEVSVRPGK